MDVNNCGPVKFLGNTNMSHNTDLVPLNGTTGTQIDIFYHKVQVGQAPTPASVVNLSKRNLTNLELSVLSFGKGFCPTPGEPNMGEIKSDLDRLHSTCRKRFFFQKQTQEKKLSPHNSVTPTLSKSTPDLQRAPPSDSHGNRPKDGLSANLLREKIFRKPSKWVPPRGPPTFETFALLNELALNRTPIRAPAKQNLEPSAKDCLRDLARDTTIVIKQADKGGALVVWDREAYITEGLRQLSDLKFYKPLDCDPTTEYSDIIHRFISDLQDNGSITNDITRALYTDKVRTPEFYLLPKIHKKTTPIPGRPIVSGNGSPTEKISAFADFLTKPYVPLIKSYVRDSSHVLEQLSTLTEIGPDTILASLDVSSLYTNIPNEEGIQACHSFLEKHRTPWSLLEREIPNTGIIELLRMVLTMNNFRFNGKHYLQVGGTAMGTRVAPTFANIYMDSFENLHVYPYSPKPRLWLRFIDDILLVWDHGPEELNKFILYLNTRHPNIKFSEEISITEVSFLDILISKGTAGRLRTDLYSKAMDANNYLHYSSAHTRSCREGIPFGQFLRIKRICSDNEDFLERCIEKALHMKRRGYPVELLRNAFASACKIERRDLLSKRNKTSDTTKDTLVGITTFHPSCSAFADTIRENWPILGRSTTTEGLSASRLIIAYRRPGGRF